MLSTVHPLRYHRQSLGDMEYKRGNHPKKNPRILM